MAEMMFKLETLKISMHLSDMGEKVFFYPSLRVQPMVI
jgi:hypothetical protein